MLMGEERLLGTERLLERGAFGNRTLMGERRLLQTGRLGQRGVY